MTELYVAPLDDDGRPRRDGWQLIGNSKDNLNVASAGNINFGPMTTSFDMKLYTESQIEDLQHELETFKEEFDYIRQQLIETLKDDFICDDEIDIDTLLSYVEEVVRRYHAQKEDW